MHPFFTSIKSRRTKTEDHKLQFLKRIPRDTKVLGVILQPFEEVLCWSRGLAAIIGRHHKCDHIFPREFFGVVTLQVDNLDTEWLESWGTGDLAMRSQSTKEIGCLFRRGPCFAALGGIQQFNMTSYSERRINEYRRRIKPCLGDLCDRNIARTIGATSPRKRKKHRRSAMAVACETVGSNRCDGCSAFYSGTRKEKKHQKQIWSWRCTALNMTRPQRAFLPSQSFAPGIALRAPPPPSPV